MYDSKLTPKFNLISILYSHALMFFCITSNNIMWNRQIGTYFPSRKVCVFVFMLLCVLGIVAKKKYNVKNTLYVFIFLFILLIPAIIHYDVFKNYALSFMIPFIVLLMFNGEYIRRNEIGPFIEAYANIMFFLATVSLFYWIFGTVLHIAPGRHQVFYQWANAIRKTFTYNYLYYETQRDIVNGVTVIRNTGIFIESPGYTSYLVYALLIELIYKKNKNLTRITILVLTMLSSTSTKGFLFLLELTILMYYFSKSGKGEIKQVIKIFGTIFLLIAVIYLAYVILLQKSATSSFLIRQDDLFSALNVWKEHILFGIGYGKTENIINNFTVSRSNNGLSMGLTLLLAQGGLYMFFIYIFAFAAAYKSANRQAERNKILIVGIIALSDMFVSVVVYNTHIIFLITMAYAYAINNNSLARSKL